MHIKDRQVSLKEAEDVYIIILRYAFRLHTKIAFHYSAASRVRAKEYRRSLEPVVHPPTMWAELARPRLINHVQGAAASCCCVDQNTTELPMSQQSQFLRRSWVDVAIVALRSWAPHHVIGIKFGNVDILMLCAYELRYLNLEIAALVLEILCELVPSMISTKKKRKKTW